MTNESTDLIVIPDNLLENMQKVIDSVAPVATAATVSLAQSVQLANGYNQLKQFLDHPQIKTLVESMANSKMGFLTDRPPGSMKWDPRQKKMVKVNPYTYPEIVEAVVPLVMEGYQFAGNHINIISGNGYRAKEGKYQHIMRLVDSFSHSVGGPLKDNPDKDGRGIAKMRCQARWEIEGNVGSIGYGDDICTIAVEYDRYAGLDKLVGQAESKLYSRVLTRITGKFFSEGELDSSLSVDPAPEPDKTDKVKDKLKADKDRAVDGKYKMQGDSKPDDQSPEKKDREEEGAGQDLPEPPEYDGNEASYEKAEFSEDIKDYQERKLPWVSLMSAMVRSKKYQPAISIIASKNIIPVEYFKTRSEKTAQHAVTTLRKIHAEIETGKQGS